MLDLAVQIRMWRHRFSLSLSPSSRSDPRRQDRRFHWSKSAYKNSARPISKISDLLETDLWNGRVRVSDRNAEAENETNRFDDRFGYDLSSIPRSLSARSPYFSLLGRKKKKLEKKKFKTVFMWLRKRRGKWRKAKETGCEMRRNETQMQMKCGKAMFLEMWFVLSIRFISSTLSGAKVFSLRWLRRVKIIKKGATRVTPAPPFGRFKSSHSAQISIPEQFRRVGWVKWTNAHELFRYFIFNYLLCNYYYFLSF